MYLFAEAYLEPRQTFRKQFFAKIVHDLKLLIVFAKDSISNVWQGSKHAVCIVMYILYGLFPISPPFSPMIWYDLKYKIKNRYEIYILTTLAKLWQVTYNNI